MRYKLLGNTGPEMLTWSKGLRDAHKFIKLRGIYVESLRDVNKFIAVMRCKLAHKGV